MNSFAAFALLYVCVLPLCLVGNQVWHRRRLAVGESGRARPYINVLIFTVIMVFLFYVSKTTYGATGLPTQSLRGAVSKTAELYLQGWHNAGSALLYLVSNHTLAMSAGLILVLVLLTLDQALGLAQPEKQSLGMAKLEEERRNKAIDGLLSIAILEGNKDLDKVRERVALLKAGQKDAEFDAQYQPASPKYPMRRITALGMAAASVVPLLVVDTFLSFTSAIWIVMVLPTIIAFGVMGVIVFLAILGPVLLLSFMGQNISIGIGRR